LPSELQKLSVEERTKEIQKRLAERSEIRKQILALSKQRTEYIAAQQKKRSEATAYNPDGSVANKTVRTAQQLEQYGPDGSLQKTGTISVENRLVDKVVLNKDGSAKKESNAPDQLDAHGNWTKMTRWQTDSQGTRPLTVGYRTLTYY